MHNSHIGEYAMPRLLAKAAAIVLLTCCYTSGFAADMAPGADDGILLQQAGKAKFISVPGVPACTTLAPLRGDMGKTASTLMVRMTAGCMVPFHWHTPSEEMVVLQGSPLAQMLGKRPYVLKVGSYSQLPTHHVHRFKCASKVDCLFFLVADGPFDIHFVDEQGKEISTEAALDFAAKTTNAKW
jgi:quercetin dioxygenase-like cupin family protein